LASLSKNGDAPTGGPESSRICVVSNLTFFGAVVIATTTFDSSVAIVIGEPIALLCHEIKNLATGRESFTLLGRLLQRLPCVRKSRGIASNAATIVACACGRFVPSLRFWFAGLYTQKSAIIIRRIGGASRNRVCMKADSAHLTPSSCLQNTSTFNMADRE
jgi:hypothetical protein